MKQNRSSFLNQSKLKDIKTKNNEEDSVSTGLKQHTKSTLTNDFSLNHNSKTNFLNKETISAFDSKIKKNKQMSDCPIDNLVAVINGQLNNFEKVICEYNEQLLFCKKSFKELD